ncbi:MAG: VOC family protein [Halioglobus sp.]
MEPRISMITLGVSDLEESAKFYEIGLGLPKMDSPPGTGFSGVTLSHNVTSEDSVREVIENAVAAGAELVKHPQGASWGGFSGYFKDRDSHLWEIAYNPYFWVGPES